MKGKYIVFKKSPRLLKSSKFFKTAFCTCWKVAFPMPVVQSKGVAASGSDPSVVAGDHTSQLWRAMGCWCPDPASERGWKTITLVSFLSSHRVRGSSWGYPCSLSNFRHAGNVYLRLGTVSRCLGKEPCQRMAPHLFLLPSGTLNLADNSHGLI